MRRGSNEYRSNREETSSTVPQPSTTRTTADDDDDDDDLERQRKRIHEFNSTMDTKRMAEEAQDEELLRLALELSINDMSDAASSTTSHHTPTHPMSSRITSSLTATPSHQQIPPVSMRRHSMTHYYNTVDSTPQSSSSVSLSFSPPQRSHSNQRYDYYPRGNATSTTTTTTTTTTTGNVPTTSTTTTTQTPMLRSILRQSESSTRSLDEFMVPSGTTTATTMTRTIAKNHQRPYRNDSVTIVDVSTPASSSAGRNMIPRSFSANNISTSNHTQMTASLDDRLLLGSISDCDLGNLEDDDDSDSDDDFLEDLDPDDTPDLKRVQQQQQRQPNNKLHSGSQLPVSIPINVYNQSESANSIGGRMDESQLLPRKKSSIPLNGADLNAASLRFQQLSSSMSDVVGTGNGTTSNEVPQQRRPVYGKRRPRPGLMVSVATPAPKVKPPGRRRTAVSLQSPAIDADVLRKIQTSSSTTTSSSNNTTTNGNTVTQSATTTTGASSSSPSSGHTNVAATSKPGAVAMMGPVRTKPQEVRSAIVSHILGGGGGVSSTITVHNESASSPLLQSPSSVDDGAGSRRFSLSGSISTAAAKFALPFKKSPSVSMNNNTMDRTPVSDHETKRPSHEDVKQSSRPAASGTPSPPKGTVWNKATVSATLTNADDTTKSDWPSVREQRNMVASSAKKSFVSQVTKESSTGDNDLTDQELHDLERAIRESATTDQSTVSHRRQLSDDDYDLAGASQYLSQEELLDIQEALNEEGQASVPTNPNYMEGAKPMARTIQSQSSLELEDEAIARALRDADEEEERRSFELAILMQQEEAKQYKSEVSGNARLKQHGNVRSMTRQEYDAQTYQQHPPAVSTRSTEFNHDYDDDDGDDHIIDGFRMNSSAQHKWSRRDHTSVVGPNQEIRTKHDVSLQNEANAHRLGFLSSDSASHASVGNQAYNSFVKSMKNTKKGVVMKGTGRAGSDSDATKGGAMDSVVRQHISSAINNEIIEKCNGVVKEGKEAMVYHADKGAESGGFDVAVKVFKKITEFRNRGYYVDGDPRFYGKTEFRNLSSKEQLEVWTDKEFRNLTRASRAGVPVPIPLFHKDNILFMRFLGDDGWPAPQLRELELNHGSRRWSTLFSQIMEAVKLLYQGGHLVHGDLSEYNILVAPSSFVVGPSSAAGKNSGEDLQVVLIDFGQAVDTRHPEATVLLQRDLNRILAFFTMHGIDVPTLDEAMALIMG